MCRLHMVGAPDNWQSVDGEHTPLDLVALGADCTVIEVEQSVSAARLVTAGGSMAAGKFVPARTAGAELVKLQHLGDIVGIDDTAVIARACSLSSSARCLWMVAGWPEPGQRRECTSAKLAAFVVVAVWAALVEALVWVLEVENPSRS